MKNFFIILALAVAASSCAVKDDSLPVVDPNAAGAYISMGQGISTTSKSIKVEDLFVYVYDVKITAYGICCSDTGTPTISNYACSYSYPVSDYAPFVINGLKPGTTYFCRPFFVISSGAVYYGDTVTATTSAAIEMTLPPPYDISQYGGLVTASATDGTYIYSPDVNYIQNYAITVGGSRPQPIK